MKNFLYNLILPFTELSFVLLTLLMVILNWFHFYTKIDVDIEMVALFNLLWGFWYLYLFFHKQKQN